ncbi:BZ3501_MvSof-1269-A2-R1_Chr12-3g03578 [Microbotryum saponariae]|nr:BZ3501_MvSof-1269-A2-R1_Chr12-3g03578 [Microbotryum saponariae]
MTIAELLVPPSMSLPPTRLFAQSCPKTSPPKWISTFGRRVDKQYGALAQRSRHFGSLDGVVTTATPLEIGSLICFGLKRGMQLRSNCLWRRTAVHRSFASSSKHAIPLTSLMAPCRFA